VLTKKALNSAKAYVKRTDPRDVAVAGIIGTPDKDTHPGPFRLMPVVGYMRRDPQKRTLAVSLSCQLFRVYDDKPMGTLGWLIPVNERTERTVCGLLTSLGWDGRIWPVDPGWPDGKEAVGLTQLLMESRLFATFVFPPEPKGSRVIRVEVPKTLGDFPLSPEVPADDFVEPTEEMMSKFRRLIAEPELFLQ
jgi:hypothetical protein